MVEVRLHGALAAQFGREWHLDIASPAEAVQAIEAGRKGFKKAILDLAAKGMVFRVRSKTHDYDNEDVNTSLGSIKRIDIIPIVEGASAAVRFVAGAVLVIASYFFPMIAKWALPVGMSLMIGSVAEWLMPKPKKQDFDQGAKSWTINGPIDTADQGLPVPVIYGEVLTTGYPISAGISIAQTVPGSENPDVEIGGQFDIHCQPNIDSLTTVVVQLSASPFGLAEPFTYTWSYTGFAIAVARRLVVANKASVRLELDYNVTDLRLSDSGNLSVSLLANKGNGEEGTVTVNSTETVRIEISPYTSEGSA